MKGGLLGLAGGGLRGLHRRQRAQQGVRRGGRARERHAAHRRRRPAEAGRRQDRPGDPGFAADAGVQQHVDPGRHRLPRRRAGLPGQGPGAQSRDPGGGELRRPHALDHRRAVADQCRPAQQGDRPQERHHGLASRRPEGGARRDPKLRPAGARGRQVRAGGGGEHRRQDEGEEDRQGRPGRARGERRPALSPRRARSRRIRQGAPERLPPCRGRPAGAGDRPVCRRAPRHDRAARQ